MTEDGGEIAKNNVFERTIKVRLDTYLKSKELLQLHPDKFAFNAYKNEYYAGMVSLASQITSEKGVYILILAFNQERNPAKDAVEMILLQPQAGKTIYRMDIKSGQETETELKGVEDRIKEFKVSEDSANHIRQFMKSRTTKVDGVSTLFESGWAETEISDTEALSILNAITKFDIPPSWAGKPTWDKVQKTKQKLGIPKKLLS